MSVSKPQHRLKRSKTIKNDLPRSNQWIQLCSKSSNRSNRLLLWCRNKIYPAWIRIIRTLEWSRMILGIPEWTKANHNDLAAIAHRIQIGIYRTRPSDYSGSHRNLRYRWAQDCAGSSAVEPSNAMRILIEPFVVKSCKGIHSILSNSHGLPCISWSFESFWVSAQCVENWMGHLLSLWHRGGLWWLGVSAPLPLCLVWTMYVWQSWRFLALCTLCLWWPRSQKCLCLGI